ncbi:DUF3179 domain-containing protein [Zoogloeaceae bacterium G21618-S1]|nr:DUF3179 domain-containing protein [Zoogloeaceae bacterium G21618-S1]
MRRQRFHWALTVLIAGALTATPALADTKNGFDLTGSSVPVEDIHPGGPPRDGIPAIDRPHFVAAAQADFLDPSDPILGIVHRGEARAYPVRILNWHEVVNDRIGGKAVAITYCPLCGSGVAFVAEQGDTTLDFGVSGLLYNSDVLLYDRGSQSLWSQLMGRAISGPMKDTILTALPLVHTTWANWRTLNPDSRVLSPNTGHQRAYERDPYAGYAENETLYFPVAFRSAGFHPKERVLGVHVGDAYKAYPFMELHKGPALFEDMVGEQKIIIRFDKTHERAEAFDSRGAHLAGTTLFWFAWYAFHPDTAVHRAP